MKFITYVVIAVMTFVTFACSIASKKPTETQPRAKMMAEALSTVLPKNLGDGMVMRSAVAEGELLVITFAGPSDMTEVWSEAELSKLAAGGFCRAEANRAYFKDGAKLRIDISSGGNPPVEGEVFDHCPGAAT